MSVKVAVRSRPLNADERTDAKDIIIRMNDNEVQVVDNLASYKFLYDAALWSTNAPVEGSINPQADQQMVYKAIGEEILQHILTGYNGCVFAYGQTGSGKTYSMMGTPENEGIIPRIARNLFREVENLNASGVEAFIEVSYYEIYNEKVRCLLRPTDGGFDDSPLRVREHPKFGPFIEGLAKFMVSSQQELLDLMADGNKVRTTGATAMNATSSRSHAVFAVTVTQNRKNGKLVTTKTSRLNLVDLAGSERASKTMATGKRLAEGANINRSLTCLGNVISALAEEQESGKTRHIPYRDSVLTWILKDNLGGNSKTVMLATISPSSAQYDETMSTLRYAERAKKIMNKAVVNESNNNEIIAGLQKEIEALRSQLKDASGSDRQKLNEELLASEAMKKEFEVTMQEKLAETRRLMEEREKYMKQLEEKLDAQQAEIDKLRNANAEKEKKIVQLLSQISDQEQNIHSPTQEKKVEELREMVAVLEQEQNATAVQATTAPAQSISGRSAGDTAVIRAEDLGQVRPTAGVKVSVREMAKAFEALSAQPAAPQLRGPHHHYHDASEMSAPSAPAAAKSGASKVPTALAGKDLTAPEPTITSTENSFGADEILEMIQSEAVAAPPAAEAAAAAAEEKAKDEPNLDDELDLDDDLELDDDLDLDDELDMDSDTPPPDDEEEGAGAKGDGELYGSAGAAKEAEEEFNDSAVGETFTDETGPNKDGAGEDEPPMIDSGSDAPPSEDGPPGEADGKATPPPASQGAPLSMADLGVDAADEAAPGAESTVGGGAAAGAAAAAAGEQKNGTVLAGDASKPPKGHGGVHSPSGATMTTLVVPSHALPNNRYLSEPFKVIKVNETALIGSKKERIWAVDMFGKRFANLDMAGYLSFEQPASNLFRVEKDIVNSKRVTLYFFDAPHPYELEFTSSDRRQRFFELATLLRRNSILWCPSLCIDGENDIILQVQGTTIDRPNAKVVKVSGETKFMIARMPYEVIDLWYGCFSMQGRSLPQSAAVLGSFLPKDTHEVYIIGVTDVPNSLMNVEDLGRYFLNYLGSALYFVLANTALESKKRTTNNALIVIVRRSFIVRVSHIEAMEVAPVCAADAAKGDFTAVGCAMRINESSLCVLLINGRDSAANESSRTGCIRTLMSNFPFGDPSVDIAQRFDYLIVSGSFGFSNDFTPEDMLMKQIEAANVLSDFEESKPHSSLQSAPNPIRILYLTRPRVCRMDVKQYQTSRALAVPNAFISADVFCQRPFLSIFGEQVSRVQFIFDKLCVTGSRLPGIRNPEIRFSAEWIDNSPISVPLNKSGDNFEISGRHVPPIAPVIASHDYLRLQTVTFSLMGQLHGSKDKRKIPLASGTLPLKNSFALGEMVDFKIPLTYRACTVGELSGSILQVYYEKNEADLAAAGVPNERDVFVVSSYENQVNGGKGTWAPSTFEENRAHPFSKRNSAFPCPRESYALPNEENWKWITKWRHEGRTDDADGWSYAEAFDQPFFFKKSKTTNVRRRRWTRVMQAKDALTLHHYLAELAKERENNKAEAGEDDD